MRSEESIHCESKQSHICSWLEIAVEAWRQIEDLRLTEKGFVRTSIKIIPVVMIVMSVHRHKPMTSSTQMLP